MTKIEFMEAYRRLFEEGWEAFYSFNYPHIRLRPPERIRDNFLYERYSPLTAVCCVKAGIELHFNKWSPFECPLSLTFWISEQIDAAAEGHTSGKIRKELCEISGLEI